MVDLFLRWHSSKNMLIINKIVAITEKTGQDSTEQSRVEQSRVEHSNAEQRAGKQE